MNVVLDDATEMNIKAKTRKDLGIEYLRMIMFRPHYVEGW